MYSLDPRNLWHLFCILVLAVIRCNFFFSTDLCQSDPDCLSNEYQCVGGFCVLKNPILNDIFQDEVVDFGNEDAGKSDSGSPDDPDLPDSEVSQGEDTFDTSDISDVTDVFDMPDLPDIHPCSLMDAEPCDVPWIGQCLGADVNEFHQCEQTDAGYCWGPSIVCPPQSEVPFCESTPINAMCGEEVVVTATIPELAENPAIAVIEEQADSHFVIAWKQNSSVWLKLYRSDGLELQRQVINSPELYTYDDKTANPYGSRIRLASLGNQRFVLVYECQEGSEHKICWQLIDAPQLDTPLETGSLLGSSTTSNHWPSSTQLTSGNFVITWHSYVAGTSTYVVNYQVFDSDGAEVFDGDYTASNQLRFADVTNTSLGGFYLTWIETVGDRDYVYGQNYKLDGDVLMTRQLIRTGLKDYTLLYPTIVNLNPWGFGVIWEEQSDLDFQSFINFRLLESRGIPFGTVRTIYIGPNHLGTRSYLLPSLSSSQGGLVVSWQVYTDDVYKGSISTTGSGGITYSGPQKVNTNTALNTKPRLASFGSTYYITWIANTNNWQYILFRKYD